jgi:mannose-6-phosphate isomerase-like protein (cupin superfamily)
MLEVGILHIDPGANSGPENMRHPGEELDICLSGRLEFRIKEVKYIIRKDDCIHFKSTVPHSWRNPTDKPVKILYVLSPPPMAYR